MLREKYKKKLFMILVFVGMNFLTCAYDIFATETDRPKP